VLKSLISKKKSIRESGKQIVGEHKVPNLSNTNKQ